MPTEVEWEWFARGGQVAIDKGTFDYKYSGSNNADEVAWYDFDFSSSIDSSFFEHCDCESMDTNKNIGFSYCKNNLMRKF